MADARGAGVVSSGVEATAGVVADVRATAGFEILDGSAVGFGPAHAASATMPENARPKERS